MSDTKTVNFVCRPRGPPSMIWIPYEVASVSDTTSSIVLEKHRLPGTKGRSKAPSALA